MARDEGGGMKTCLCTGSSGFVGRHLVGKLIAAGYEVYCIDPRNRAALKIGTDLYFMGTFEEAARSAYLMPADVVVHLAANIPSIDDRMKGGMSAFADLELDLAMCRYIEAHPPRECFVAMSSCATDNPEDPYAFCKVALERFCHTLHKRGVPVAILKPYSGYGADQAETYPFRAILERAIRREDPLTVWGALDTVRDFVHIDDLTDAILWAITDAPRGIPVPVGTGRGTTMAMLATKIADAVGYHPKVVADTSKPASSSLRIADTSIAAHHGWRAKVSLEEGINRAVEERTGKCQAIGFAPLGEEWTHST